VSHQGILTKDFVVGELYECGYTMSVRDLEAKQIIGMIEPNKPFVVLGEVQWYEHRATKVLTTDGEIGCVFCNINHVKKVSTA